MTPERAFIEQLSQVELNIRHREVDNLGGQQLIENTAFQWKDRASRFGGYSEDELKQLVGLIGNLIGITPQQAALIYVNFGDQFVPDDEDDDSEVFIAACSAEINDDDSIAKCQVFINRSREIHDASPDVDAPGQIDCLFEHPLEGIVWIMAEELKHAQIFTIAGSKTRSNAWDQRYIEILNLKGKVFSQERANDLQEVAVSRVALKVLARLAYVFAPDREEYFKSLYQDSLSDWRNVVPVFYKIVDQTFVKTGFDTNNINKC